MKKNISSIHRYINISVFSFVIFIVNSFPVNSQQIPKMNTDLQKLL